MAEHGVELMQLFDLRLDHGRLDAQPLGHFGLALVILRQEFMQRRIKQPHRHRQTGHRGEDTFEILALQRE